MVGLLAVACEEPLRNRPRFAGGGRSGRRCAGLPHLSHIGERTNGLGFEQLLDRKT